MLTLVACPRCGADNRVDPERPGSPICGKCKSELSLAAPGHPIDTTTARFESDVVRSGVPTIVDFWAAWCGPCKMTHPVFERLARAYAGRVRFVRVNVDEEPYLAQRFQASSIPLFVLFRGIEAGRLTGAMPEEQMRAFIDRLAS